MNMLHTLGVLAGLKWLTNAFRKARLARSGPVRKPTYTTRIETKDDVKPGQLVNVDGKIYRVKKTKVISESGQVRKEANIKPIK